MPILPPPLKKKLQNEERNLFMPNWKKTSITYAKLHCVKLAYLSVKGKRCAISFIEFFLKKIAVQPLGYISTVENFVGCIVAHSQLNACERHNVHSGYGCL